MQSSSSELKDVFLKQKKKTRRQNFFKGIMFLLPSIILFSLFLFYPMIKTLYLSFFLTDMAGTPTVFVGLDNYIQLYTSDIFRKSFISTFLFVLYIVPTSIIIALFLAVLANEKLKGVGLFRTMYSSTMGISVAAGSIFWMYLFNPSMGLLNEALGVIGIDSIGWLTDPDWALIAISLTTIWMNIGFTFLILLGGLQSIDQSLYENANIEGAGYFRKLFQITVPMLSPTLFFVLVVTIINAFQTFGQIDILTKGGPQYETNLIVYSIYREAFVNRQFGPASAQAVVLFVIILIMTVVQFKFAEGKVHYQ